MILSTFLENYYTRKTGQYTQHEGGNSHYRHTYSDAMVFFCAGIDNMRNKTMNESDCSVLIQKSLSQHTYGSILLEGVFNLQKLEDTSSFLYLFDTDLNQVSNRLVSGIMVFMTNELNLSTNSNDEIKKKYHKIMKKIKKIFSQKSSNQNNLHNFGSAIHIIEGGFDQITSLAEHNLSRNIKKLTDESTEWGLAIMRKTMQDESEVNDTTTKQQETKQLETENKEKIHQFLICGFFAFLVGLFLLLLS